MRRPGPNEIEHTRAELPSLLAEAERGSTTVITRDGRPVAVVAPWHAVRTAGQKSLLPLVGSGKGFWRGDSSGTLRRMRNEWDR